MMIAFCRVVKCGAAFTRIWAKVELAHAYAASNRRVEAEKILAEYEGQPEQGNLSPYQMAIIYTGLGERVKLSNC